MSTPTGTDGWVGKGAVKVRLLRFAPVASETHNTTTTHCGICKRHLTGPAGVESKTGKEDNRVVKGKCGHLFHYCCITRHIDANGGMTSCPICRLPWEFATNSMDEHGLTTFLAHRRAKRKKAAAAPAGSN